MTDQELLGLAAKAVGLSFASQNVTSHGVYCNDATWWSPLTDDGDALRLAVKLQMEVAIFEAECHTRCVERRQQDWFDEAGDPYAWFDEAGDPYAATRRAIVKAAAEIGKAMK